MVAIVLLILALESLGLRVVNMNEMELIIISVKDTICAFLLIQALALFQVN